MTNPLPLLPTWKASWIRSAKNALLFVTGVLNAVPDPWQAQALREISNHNRLTIRSGHGVGKTTILAWIAIWFMFTRKPVKIIITANSQDQLRDITWSELHRWLRVLPAEMLDTITMGAERITLKADPENCFIVARTASKDKPEAMQGFHSEFVLYLCEEASGIDDIVFEVAGGALTADGAKMVMGGNPTRSSGYFFDAFHKNRELWRCMHVPCAASPRVSQSYIKEIADQYGILSNVYRVRVLGEFPVSSDDAVIPLDLVEPAITRDVLPIAHRAIVWGVDVGRGGDMSALCKRQGNYVLEKVKTWNYPDVMATTGVIAREYFETPEDKRPAAINVDVIGVGAGVADRLTEIGLPCHGINVGETSTDPTRFMRMRDELWFAARDWFMARDCRIPNDEVLISELTAPTFKPSSSGKTVVESKDDLKKRNVRSPNAADAFCLTFAGGEYLVQTARTSHAQMDYDPLEPYTDRRSRGQQVRAEFDESKVW